MDRRKTVKKGNKSKAKSRTYTAYTCDICSKQFGDKYAVLKHRAIHSDVTPYQCSQCEYAGKTRQYLRKHVRVKHGDKKFGCDICGKFFHYECKLRDHMRVHTGEKPYKCGECDKAFSSSYSFNTHKLIHSNSKPYKCSYCPYECRDGSTLRKHQARHTGQMTYYNCTVCSVSCATKSLLKMHIAEKHFSVDMKRLECDHCGKRFKIKSDLARHIRSVHDRAMTGACDVCGAVLSNRNNLRSHMRIHVDERPYVCTYEGCDKRYKCTSALKKHIIKHYPSRQYACKICDKMFSREIRMQRHLKTHMTKVKDVECDYCHVRFYNKNYLTTHIRRKHGRKKKKYICDLCDFVTTNKPSLVMHIKYGHAVSNNLTCAVCEKKFKRHFNLKLHYWTAHEVEYNIPDAPEQKPQKTEKPEVEVEVKVEKTETENETENETGFFVVPKIEPLDDEGLEELTNIAPEPEVRAELEDIPEEAIEQFITPVVRGREVRLFKYAQENNIDKTCDERVKERVKGILEETRQKREKRHKEIKRKRKKRDEERASRELERTRRKYNMLIRKAIERKMKEGKVKKVDRKNDKQHPNSLLVENFSITQTIDSTGCIRDEVSLDDMEQQELEENQETIDIVENNTKDNNDEEDKSGEAETTDENKIDNEVEEETSNEEAAKSNEPEKADRKLGKNRKLKINTHQCYVCFKLYQTKEDLLNHCRDHFDLCSVQTLKKCPICNYTTNLSITTHLKKKHDITVKVPYGSFKDNKELKGTGYYYEVNDERIKKVEIIPSIKNLNKRESCKIDKQNREKKNKDVVKDKLVKKGKEWIVLKEKVKINPTDCLLPDLGKLESKNAKLGYIDRLKELYKVARKKGKKMMFPCDSCDKVCQTLAALKLHGRKHEVNPTPFKPKVWKHKMKNKRQNANDLKQQRVVTNIDNRTAKPKPVVNKHKCDKELIEFYESNIRGGDIEFWQFLKIYNKMGRENVNDFEDLQKSHHFGLHCNEPVENTNLRVENNGNNGTVTNNSNLIRAGNNSNEMRLKYNNNAIRAGINRNISVKSIDKINKSSRSAFTRVVRLSKKEVMKRNEARKRLREKISGNSG